VMLGAVIIGSVIILRHILLYPLYHVFLSSLCLE
jgi:hypothetical protein